ncbi:MAG: OmpA family protein [Rickettsiales bacterium]|nr:OmpA family protein [Pseudomonadota bacterium]MDA0966753.1 OmpA family protein [Pseudomonadota bacterium]MDG4543425.1 OmpA family protein [Rickettsiales bacterium]MDG4546181.1 OmpA family protein [Rickettsiales bacterium]MDG4547654.1 OmpA family protein [Rickettsiales bacterium]
MKKFIVSAIFSIASLSAVPTFADGSDQKVVVDKFGRPITSIVSGECVLTKWQSDSDLCAAPEAASVPEPQKKIVSTLKKQPAPKTYTVSDKRSYIVFFDFNKSNINGTANEVLGDLYKAIRGSSKADIELTGHADRSGSDAYNMALSEKRALAVKDKLVSYGLSAGNIKVNWKGESEPLVPTNDGIKEPQNRRTEIKVFTQTEQTR